MSGAAPAPVDLRQILARGAERFADELQAGAAEIAQHSQAAGDLARGVVERAANALAQAARGEILAEDAEVAVLREADALWVLTSEAPAEAALTQAALRLIRGLGIAREVGLAGLRAAGAAAGGAALG